MSEDSLLRFYADPNFKERLAGLEIDLGVIERGKTGRRTVYMRNENTFDGKVVIKVYDERVRHFAPDLIGAGKSAEVSFEWDAPPGKEVPLFTRWSVGVVWLPKAS